MDRLLELKTQRISQVKVPVIAKSGAEHIAYAYTKYGVTPPTDIIADVTQRGSDPAYALPYDIEYLCVVTVGNTKMLLDFDTGSSDFWVFSSELPRSQRGRHILYPLSGVNVPYETWSISYGDGSFASGDVYAGKVAIGPVIAPVLSFGAASNLPASFTNDYIDGIVGLDFLPGATFKPKTVLTFMSKVGPTLSQTSLLQISAILSLENMTLASLTSLSA
ncbi:aspartic peptidase domain-containing protein [Lipomyces starkeyi]